MHHPDELTPPRMVTSGRARWWVFDDGTRLPVIAGGSGDDDTDEDDTDESGDDTDDDDEEDEDDEDDEDLDPKRARAAMRKKNRENANLRRRLKAAEADQAELKKIRDKEKSDGQRLGETTEALTKAELKAARLEVALEKGLTLAQANRLVGSTKDELAEDADAYLEELGVDDDERPTKKKTAPRRPKEKIRRSGTGTTDTDDDGEDDPRALAAKVARRF